ncbi:MAG: RNA polymerase sigma factor [Bacteroidota bacterium]
MIIALLNNYGQYSDEYLVEHYRQSGNSFFVGELYKRYSLPVTAICFSYFKERNETEDTVMEVFEMVLADLKKYEVQNFKAWLLTSVKHYCLKKKEKNQRKTEKERDFKKTEKHFMELQEELSPTDKEADTERVLVQLQQAISQLKGEQKTCLELFYLQDQSYQEIAESTGYDINKVKSYIQNGKRNLKLFMEENG